MHALGKWILQRWLFICARLSVARHKPFTIAITGSTHKTLVKEYLCTALKEHGHMVRSHPKSYNTEIGLPLTILSLESGQGSVSAWLRILVRALGRALFERNYPGILIVELGADHPGDIPYLLAMIQPTIAVVTTVTSQYISQFGDLERTAIEFSLLVKNIPKKGLVVLNGDDVRVQNLEKRTKASCCIIGSSQYSTAIIKEIDETGSAQSWTLCIEERQQRFQTERRGEHHRFALSAAKIIHQWIDTHRV